MRRPIPPMENALAFFLPLAIILSAALPSCAPADPWAAPARRLVASMEPRALVGQIIMTGLPGGSGPSNDASAVVSALSPGAVLLFGFNVSAGPEALREYTSSLQAALPPGSPPLLFAIDHEGGGVWRFGSELSRLPSAEAVGARLDPKGLEALGDIAGRELSALGIGLSLSPVVEPLSQLNRAFMRGRCYSPDPARAALLAASFARGLQGAGVGACYKHYPASAAADPHRGPSVLDAPLSELEAWGLLPFKRAIRIQEPAAVMLSHAIVLALDPERPASLSSALIGRLKEGGYRGIVLTDDLLMAGSGKGGSSGEAALEALAAGADMVMLSSPREALRAARFLEEALAEGRLDRMRLQDACLRVIRAKLSLGLEREADPMRRSTSLEGFTEMVASGRNFIQEAMMETDN